MRRLFLALSIVLASTFAIQAPAQVRIDIGINVPVYPQLVRVPGYPVYYDPRADYNYFFYDGFYWVYQDDNWYQSGWYDGPWQAVGPRYVPLFVLRVPVRYYRQPPAYFRGWRGEAPPHWGEHWGRDWERRRAGWDRWDRQAVPRAAPLPVYQRQYTGERYPRAVQQQSAIRSQQHGHQPRDAQTRPHGRPQAVAQPPSVQRPAPGPPRSRSEPSQPGRPQQAQPRDRGPERRDAPRNMDKSGRDKADRGNARQDEERGGDRR